MSRTTSVFLAALAIALAAVGMPAWADLDCDTAGKQYACKSACRTTGNGECDDVWVNPSTCTYHYICTSGAHLFGSCGCTPGGGCFLAGTLIYPRVVLDAQGGGWLYSGLVIPFMLVPVVAWLGRRRSTAAPQ